MSDMTSADEIIQAGIDTGVLCVDVESSGYPPGHKHGYLRSIQFGTLSQAWFFDVQDPRTRPLVEEVLSRSPRLTAHNAHADIRWLSWDKYADLSELWNKTLDTLIMHRILYPTRDKNDLKSLGKLYAGGHSARAMEELKRVFSKHKWLINTSETTPIERSGWAQIPIDNPVYITYAKSDTLDGAALCLYFAGLLHDQQETLASEHRTARLLSEGSNRGMRVNYAQVGAMRERLQPQIDDSLRKLNELGVANPNSPKQVLAAFEDQGTPVSSTDKHHLNPLAAAGNELAKQLLRYREASKGLSTTVEGIASYAQATGRIHSNFNTLGARTGRFSSSEPNLQNLPRAEGYRECLMADEGEILISVDFSSVEPRVLAALSQDEGMLELYRTDGDPYWQAARHVYGPDATKAHRQAMKSAVLGVAYMGGAEGISAQNGLPVEENRKAKEMIGELFPKLKAWSYSVAEDINRGFGYTTIPSGRRVYIPGDAAYKTGNAQAQGFARDLYTQSLHKMEDRGVWSWFRCAVHDETVASVPEDRVDEAKEILLECMTTEFRGVPITAEVEVLGKYWRKV